MLDQILQASSMDDMAVQHFRTLGDRNKVGW